MKRATSSLLALLAFSFLGTAEALAQPQPTWERSIEAGTHPEWLVDGLYRGLAYGRVAGRHRLYIAGRTDGPVVRILDADTGDDIGYLNTANVTGGFFPINDVEVSDDGVIFACNMTIDAGTDPFRVYRWDGEDGAPVVVIEAGGAGWEGARLGDKFTITGTVRDGTVTLYAAATNRDEIHRFTSTDGGWTFTSSRLETGIVALSTPSVAPLGPGDSPFYINSSGRDIFNIDLAMEMAISLPDDVLDGPGNNSIKFVHFDDKAWLLTYDYFLPGAYLIDVSEGPETARRILRTQPLGPGGWAMTTFGQGDVSFRVNDDGEVSIYVLATNVGFAMYRLQPKIQVATHHLAFGETGINGSRTNGLRIDNIGYDRLEVEVVSITRGAFTVGVEGVSVIGPGDHLMLPVTFAPLLVGEFFGELMLRSNDIEESDIIVRLSGSGMLPPEILIQPSSITSELHTGETDEHTTIITNIGTGLLRYTTSTLSVPTPFTAKTGHEIRPLGQEFIALDKAQAGQHTAGAPVATALSLPTSGGPDAFGYTWVDSSDPDGIAFEWLGAGAGTTLSLGDDDFVENIPLGFTFNYYGRSFDRVGISSNGWLSFVAIHGWLPRQIPYVDHTIAPIGPYVHDLDPGQGGYIRYRMGGEAPLRYFVVEYNNIPLYSDHQARITFSAVFFETANTIRFLYQSVPRPPVAVGIESPDQLTGIGNNGRGTTYLNPSTVRANYAIEFSARPRWLAVSPAAGILEPGDSADLSVQINASRLLGGSYAAAIAIHSNDPAHPRVDIPVLLNVTGPPEVSGTVTSTEGSPFGILLTAQPGGVTAHADSLGNFSFSELFPGPYTITPRRLGYTFSPDSRVINIAREAITGLDFLATSTGMPLSEVEPNDTMAEANVIGIGDQLTGRIDPVADVDIFGFFALRNDTLEVVLEADGEGRYEGYFGIRTVGGAWIFPWWHFSTQHGFRLIYRFPGDGIYYAHLFRYNPYVSSAGSEGIAQLHEGAAKPASVHPTLALAGGVVESFGTAMSEVTHAYRLGLQRHMGLPPLVTLARHLAFDTEIRVSAEFMNNENNVSIWLEYGRTPELGSVTETQVIEVNAYTQVVVPSITGLEPETEYYFRIITENRVGIANSGVYSSRTAALAEGWERRPMVATGRVNDVYFLNETDGIAITLEGEILRTSDGGLSWATSAVFRDEHLSAVAFGTSLHGVIASSAPLYTEDGGLTWHRSTMPQGTWMTDVAFAGPEVALAVTGDGRVLRSSDAGRTWQSRPAVSQDALNSIQFINADRGWISGGSGFIARTDDGGLTWTRLTSPASSWYPVESLSFIDQNVGYAATPWDVLVTRNGGDSWDIIHIPGADWLNGVYAMSASDVLAYGGLYMGGSFGLWRTKDGGMTWIRELTGSEAEFFTATGIGMSAVAAGEFGTILQSGSSEPMPPPAHWQLASGDDNHATIVVPTFALPSIRMRGLRTGDAVGAFFVRGDTLVSAGYGIWTANTHLTFYVRGDSQSEEKDGFVDGETIQFRLWNAFAGREFDAVARVASGTMAYAAETTYQLASLVSGRAVITFIVDMTPARANIGPGTIVGVRGEPWPLMWWETTEMQPTSTPNVFSVRVDMSGITPDTRIEFKYVYHMDESNVTWEARVGQGGSFGNRILNYTGESIVTPMICWNNSVMCPTPGIGVNTEDEASLPSTLTLHQNYPNPFNPVTAITLELPAAAPVTLKVYDLAGREVATLLDGTLSAGRHRVDWDAGRLASGVYLARLIVGSETRVRKMVLLK
jgi:photosystem II stability/assembly factor-like uncharacterized protein